VRSHQRPFRCESTPLHRFLYAPCFRTRHEQQHVDAIVSGLGGVIEARLKSEQDQSVQRQLLLILSKLASQDTSSESWLFTARRVF
jgi:hypothetical protein